MSHPLHCFGALALETAAPPARDQLGREALEALGARLALDLGRVLPGVEALDLAFAAAHFDPCELLRPGWPVHAALADLARAAPGGARGRVIGYGAHQGAMPLPALTPQPDLRGGPLRLLPFALLGEPGAAAAVGRAMEERLLDTGMADAATALHLQEAFGARLEHVRYLSLHDLCALTAMQYEHAGLGTLWLLIEAALLTPDAEQWLDAPREPLARWHDGEVLIAEREGAASDAAARNATAAAGAPPDASLDSSDPAARLLRRRQFEAVLHAHGIHTRRRVVAQGVDARAALAMPAPRPG